MNLDDYDESSAVENVLESLRQKEVVRPDFFSDLGDIAGQPTKPQPRKDPVIKMKLRHDQVSCLVILVFSNKIYRE